MITKWLCTGDIHGRLDRFQNFDFGNSTPENTAMIILGDAGFNYYLSGRDDRMKQAAAKLPCTFYCVRGNHEARPEDIPGMTTLYDKNVDGTVYYQPEYPNIRYFWDGSYYYIAGRHTLVLGGAYSIDKHYRLAQGWQWFENEQLNKEERDYIYHYIEELIYTNDFDVSLVLSHTAPEAYEPRELFLNFIDQSAVDKTMEVWLQSIYELLPDITLWLFGHYHGDMIMGDNIAMLYNQIIDLTCIDTFDHGSVELPSGFRVAMNYNYQRISEGRKPL